MRARANCSLRELGCERSRSRATWHRDSNVDLLDAQLEHVRFVVVLPRTCECDALRDSTNQVKKWGASELRVDTRAWALLICRADRPNLGWRWVMGWVMVDARTKKRVGELAGRRHTDRSQSYLCAVRRSVDHRVARGVFETSAFVRREVGPSANSAPEARLCRVSHAVGQEGW